MKLYLLGVLKFDSEKKNKDTMSSVNCVHCWFWHREWIAKKQGGRHLQGAFAALQLKITEQNRGSGDGEQQTN